MTAHTPRVSIAIPVYNAEATLASALDSALAQTLEDIEIVVSDNASTDGTVALVESYRDPRIVLHRNAENVGAIANMNAVALRCRAPFVKFLHADDSLYPRCVERLAEAMRLSDRVGLAFSRRRIDIPPGAGPNYERFQADFAHAYRNFGPLQPVNDGRAMLRRWIAAGLADNWIGEPSNVMMSRAAIASVGLFDARLRMLNDLDLWARTMARFDVGFVDEELSAYTFHPGNVTLTQGASSRWMDPLWALESLAADPEAAAALPELARARASERRRVAKRFIRGAARDPSTLPSRLTAVQAYLGFTLRRTLRRPVSPPPRPLST